MKMAMWQFLTIAVMVTSDLHADDPPQIRRILPCGTIITIEIKKPLPPADFAHLGFELRDGNWNAVSTTLRPIDAGGIISGATLTLTLPLPSTSLFAVLQKDGIVVDTEPVPQATDLLHFDPFNPRKLEATFRCEVDPKTIKVNITREKKEKEVSLLDKVGTNIVVMLHLGDVLRHEDQVKVTAMALNGGSLTVTKEVPFPKPEDQENALLYASGKLELAEDSKPNVLVDFKLDLRTFSIRDSIEWFHGPAVLVDAATQDEEGAGTATLGYGVRKLGFFVLKGADNATPTNDDRFILTQLDLAALLELDSGLNNRSFVTDARYQLQFPGLPWDLRPSIGVELGKNLSRPKSDDFEGYEILRPTLDLYVGREWEIEGVQVVKAITFSIDVQSRFLFESEPDTVKLPPSQRTEDMTTKLQPFDNGGKAYGKATLKFDFSEHVGIALEYERGERPPLYGNENKGGIAVVYAF